jgi:hypothetical protein
MVLVASALYGMFFLLTLYMQQGLSWTALHTGLAYVPFGLGVLPGIATASQLVPKLGVRPLVVAGMGLSAGVWFCSAGSASTPTTGPRLSRP